MDIAETSNASLVSIRAKISGGDWMVTHSREGRGSNRVGGFPRWNRIDYTYSYLSTSTIRPGGDTAWRAISSDTSTPPICSGPI